MESVHRNVGAGALDGIKVLDFGRMVAAPYCTMMLANMGAEVIKIEEPGTGDISRVNLPKQGDESAYFVAYNCSKYGITVDLKSEQGKGIVKKLIKDADVLVENFRPGVMDRLGLGYQQAAEINPGIVYASISGFGQTGELAQRAAFDPIAQAMSGMMSVTGLLDGECVRCGASIADILAGQNAAYAILAALLYREKSGKGQWIDVALADSCISALASVNQIYLTTGEIPKPLGSGFEASAPGNCYRTRDGSVVLLAGRNSEWRKLAVTLGRSDWLKNDAFRDVPDRVRNRSQLDAEINKETQKYTTGELLDLLLEAKLPAGELLDIKQVAELPHFKDTRNMFVEVEHPTAGTMRVTNLPIHMSATQPHVYSCAPLLGQDNEKVLSALGYSPEQILKLKEASVI